MIPLPAIRARIKDQVPAFRFVRGAAALSDALARGQFTDEAFVLVLDKKAGQNTVVNAVSQMTTAVVAVMYWMRDAGDVTGQNVADENEQTVDAIGAAILNWSPAPAFSNFEYAGGRLVQFAPPGALYSEEFTTQFLVRKTA